MTTKLFHVLKSINMLKDNWIGVGVKHKSINKSIKDDLLQIYNNMLHLYRSVFFFKIFFNEV